MGKALYRAYRPKKLDEVVGQEHITDTLARALEQGSISHAYLLTGPRGVGKTSIARIMAYEFNGIPYDEDATHLDIIEIDAASNRRIDEIRELKERVNVSPTSAKYKVYIIDEVHMLTKEAFNALLKTLEEPPEHAIFILATTEAHKVPETIVSRTQRFTFKPVDQKKVVTHLKKIAKKEKITIDEDALQLIAAHGEGSFRDSISLLDQVRHTSQHIKLADVQQAIGQAPDELLVQLVSATAVHDPSLIMKALDQLRTQGSQPAQIAKQLAARIRAGLRDGNDLLSNHDALLLLRLLLAVPGSHDPGLALEIALYEIALDTAVASPPATATVDVKPSTTNRALQTPEPPDRTMGTDSAKTATKQTFKERDIEKLKTDSSKAHSPKEENVLNPETWQQILDAIKVNHNTLYSITRMAEPTFNDDTLILAFAFPFHQKRLNDGKHRQVLLDIINDVTGQNVSLEVVIDKNRVSNGTPVRKSTVKPRVDVSADLEAISNIFGGAEIVE